MPSDILSLPAEELRSSFAELDDTKVSKAGEVKNEL